MLGVALISIVIIIVFIWRLEQQHKKSGVQGWVVDQDLDGGSDRIYRNSQLAISCRPDVVERNRTIEDKSADIRDKPRWGDVMQVAAQVLATGKEEASIRYPNRTFNLHKKNPLMQNAIKEVKMIGPLMRRHLETRIAPKGKPSRKKCTWCEFRSSCPDVLY